MVRNIFLTGTLARAESLDHDTAFQRVARGGQAEGSRPPGCLRRVCPYRKDTHPLEKTVLLSDGYAFPRATSLSAPGAAQQAAKA